MQRWEDYQTDRGVISYQFPTREDSYIIRARKASDDKKGVGEDIFKILSERWLWIVNLKQLKIKIAGNWKGVDFDPDKPLTDEQKAQWCDTYFTHAENTGLLVENEIVHGPGMKKINKSDPQPINKDDKAGNPTQ